MQPFPQYRLKRQRERIGPLDLEIECLEDLNATIDQLFADIQRTGDTRALEDLCPYFGVVWPSARALSEHLVGTGQDLGNKRCLEVGCGLALPSIVATRLGARVTAVDFHPEVERFLARNRELNDARGIEYHRMDWTHEDQILGRYELILGSDILYEKQQPPLVASFIDRHLADNGTAIIADPARPYLQAFVDEMKARDFRVDSSVRTAHDTPVPKDVFILELARG